MVDQLQGSALLEEVAVEPPDLLADRGRECPLIHGPPEVFHHAGEDRRLFDAVLQQALETIFGQQPHKVLQHSF